MNNRKIKKEQKRIKKAWDKKKRIGKQSDIKYNYFPIAEIYSENKWSPFDKEDYIIGKLKNKYIKTNTKHYNTLELGGYSFNTKLNNNIIFDTAFDENAALCVFTKDNEEAISIYDKIKYSAYHKNIFFSPLDNIYYINPFKGDVKHVFETMKILLELESSEVRFTSHRFSNIVNERVLYESISFFKQINCKLNLNILLEFITDKEYALKIFNKHKANLDEETILVIESLWEENSSYKEYETISIKIKDILDNEFLSNIFNCKSNEMIELNLLDTELLYTKHYNVIVSTYQNIIGEAGDIIGKILYNDFQTSIIQRKKEDRYDILIFNDNWKYFNENTILMMGQVSAFRAISHIHLNSLDEIIYNNTKEYNNAIIKKLILEYTGNKIIRRQDINKFKLLEKKYILGRNENVYIYE